MMDRRRYAAWTLSLAACQFGGGGPIVTGGADVGAAETGGGSSGAAGDDGTAGPTPGGADAAGDDGSIDSTTGSADDGPTATGGDPDSTASSDDATTGAPGTALLEVVQAPTVDYGFVGVGATSALTLDISNTGTGNATELVSSISGPFTFVGGAYPGLGGDCGRTLGGGEQCSVEIAFEPGELGPAEGDLKLIYDDGASPNDTGAVLAGEGSGSTGELVVNGNGSACANSVPTAWTDTGPGSWRCDDGFGAFYDPSGFYGDGGPNNQTFVLEQNIDLLPFANAIATGAMEFDHGGFGRTLENQNDSYRMRVRYRDAMGAVVATVGSGWRDEAAWAEWSGTRELPATTVSAEFQLQCQKSSGTFCEAYLDDLTLIGTYP